MPEVSIDGLLQERRNSIANALELRLSCTNPSILSPAESALISYGVIRKQEQHHENDYWCHYFWHCQAISSHDIDDVKWGCSFFFLGSESQQSVTFQCQVMITKKCKCIFFMFPPINSVHKVLNSRNLWVMTRCSWSRMSWLRTQIFRMW